MNEQTYPWYMVNKDGMCTLCADQADAEQEAKNAQDVWPHMGPHRAVRLVEVGDAGFTAADMATAEARGFRDGQAEELAAMRAGGEPVATIYVTPDGAREMDDWGVPLPEGATKLYTHPQPATQDAERKPLGFFAMSDDFGFERHSTAQGARASANAGVKR